MRAALARADIAVMVVALGRQASGPERLEFKMLRDTASARTGHYVRHLS